MAVLLLVYAILSTQVFYNSLVKNTQESLKIYMNLFEDGGYSLDEEGAKEYSEKLSGLRVTFLDREGEVLGDSSGENLDDHSDREEVKEALASRGLFRAAQRLARRGYGVLLSQNDAFGRRYLSRPHCCFGGVGMAGIRKYPAYHRLVSPSRFPRVPAVYLY